MMNKLIFVCSPFRAKKMEDLRSNMRLARIACHKVTEAGNIPIAPHVYFPEFMDDNNPRERKHAMKMGRKLLARCDAIWVVGDHISEGMAWEIAEALRLGLDFVEYR